MAQQRWKRAANKAARLMKETRPEWRGFGDQTKLHFLQSFEEPEDRVGLANMSSAWDSVDAPDGATVDRAMLLQYFRSDREFAKQTMLVCLERRRGQLGKYVELAWVATLEEERGGGAQSLSTASWWRDVATALLAKAVRMEDRRALREVLANLHSRSPPIVADPQENEPALILACTKDNLELVRPLVEKGYRLRSSHFTLVDHDAWSALPFHRPRPAQHDAKDDEVLNLHILRAMARPCYVYSCYAVVTESIRNGLARAALHGDADDDAERTERCTFPNCDCHGVDRGDSVDVGAGARVSDHCCPDSKNFEPQLGCVEHAACNDPIFRFFELSTVASSYASRVPEYREELEAVAASCSRHAVDLLDLCKDTGEVEILLREKAGSTAFFHKSAVKRMRYPRLQMAILNNHKTFVGHTYCQQLLRNEWHGAVPWQGKSFLFRLTYILVQTIMIPWWSLIHLIKMIFEDFGLTNDEDKRPKCFPSVIYNYIMGPNNLDEPLNRFLSFTIMYFFFLFFIIYCIFSPVIEAEELKNNFHWYHDILAFMTAATFLQVLMSLKSSLTLARGINLFWKTYDMLLCILLGFAFLFRSLMGKLHECPNEFCDKETLEARIPYDTMSNCFFSVSGIMAITRLLYWFQLHDKVGPIVINLSRVIVDVFTFLAVFGIMVCAYTIALVPLKAINSRCENYTDYIVQETTTPAAGVVRVGVLADGREDDVLEDGECWFEWKDNLFVAIFRDMFSLIFWGMLAPEYPEGTFTESPEGFFAISIYAVYCIITIIVLLNLLIAVMNATIQKVQDRKHLYWKFVRTSIWIEFFNDAYALPPPFSICNNIRSLLKGIVKRSIGLFRKVKSQLLPRRRRRGDKAQEATAAPPRETDGGEGGNAHQLTPFLCAPLQGPPSPSKLESAARQHDDRQRQRRAHDQLMVSLIQIYWAQRRQKSFSSLVEGVTRRMTTRDELGMSEERDDSHPDLVLVGGRGDAVDGAGADRPLLSPNDQVKKRSPSASSFA